MMTSSERPDLGNGEPVGGGASPQAAPADNTLVDYGGAGAEPATGPVTAALRRRMSRRSRIIVILSAVMIVTGLGLSSCTYYIDSVPTPAELTLPEATTVYYADGRTSMAKLGEELRTLLKYNEMSDAVKHSVVAAEDKTFWTNAGIDFKGVLRAAWNNFTGGEKQGASTITQQYARVAAELKGVTYSRKLREAVIAWKLAGKYSKEEILEFYLNTVPFGRGAYGIEAAAQAYFGKTANKTAPAARQVTVAEAMVLAGMIKQPEADPDNPDALPGYDPTRSPLALQNAKDRWNYIRGNMVDIGALTPAQATALQFPNTVKKFDPKSVQSGLDLPTGVAVSHVLSELRQTEFFRNKAKGYIENGGFRIITTLDPRAQVAAEEAADITRASAPAAVRGQPKNWQAALVAVEPGTGRVLAYYGGNEGAGADFAGWYLDEQGDARGFGQHPPGSSIKIYDVAEALRQNVDLFAPWDAPDVKEFPASGRVVGSPAGPVRNAATAPCQPSCTLVESTVASLNVPFFELTERLGVGNVIDMIRKAGIDYMWANVPGQSAPVRTDLRSRSGADLAPIFSTEVGIGQYGITVMDHANGLATLAAGGKRAQLHFVRSVEKNGRQVYEENTDQTEIGITKDQSDLLNWTLSQVPTAQFSSVWEAAGKTGTWQYSNSTTRNAHVWMVGYTRALAAAVWLGTKDGGPLITKTGATNVFGSTFAGPIWRQFMSNATDEMRLDTRLRRFDVPNSLPTPTPSESPSPSPSESPSPGPTESPTPSPDLTLPPTPSPDLTPPVSPPPLSAPLVRAPRLSIKPARGRGGSQRGRPRRQ